jgi:hypothetical protein
MSYVDKLHKFFFEMEEVRFYSTKYYKKIQTKYGAQGTDLSRVDYPPIAVRARTKGND